MRAVLALTALLLFAFAGCQSGPEANQRRLERQLHRLEQQVQGLTDDQRLSAAERQRRLQQLSREIARLLETLAETVESEINLERDATGKK